MWHVSGSSPPTTLIVKCGFSGWWQPLTSSSMLRSSRRATPACWSPQNFTTKAWALASSFTAWSAFHRSYLLFDRLLHLLPKLNGRKRISDPIEADPVVAASSLLSRPWPPRSCEQSRGETSDNHQPRAVLCHVWRERWAWPWAVVRRSGCVLSRCGLTVADAAATVTKVAVMHTSVNAQGSGRRNGMLLLQGQGSGVLGWWRQPLPADRVRRHRTRNLEAANSLRPEPRLSQ